MPNEIVKDGKGAKAGTKSSADAVPKEVFEKRTGELTKRFHQMESRAKTLEKQLGQALEALKVTNVAKAEQTLPKSPKGYTMQDLEAVRMNPDSDETAREMASMEMETLRESIRDSKMMKMFSDMQQAASGRSAEFGKAASEFPELGDPTSKLYEKTNEIINANPDLASNPGFLSLAAKSAYGELAREELPTLKSKLSEEQEARRRFEQAVHPDGDTARPVTDEAKGRIDNLAKLREQAYGNPNATDQDRVRYNVLKNELVGEGLIPDN